MLWRALWILGLWYCCEGLARYRFDLQNIWLPMALRDNLAVTALDSHRLVVNFQGQSRSGLQFYTDELGFRCGNHQNNTIASKFLKSSANTSTLILGGDSIAFGMYQDYENSLGFQLEQFLPHTMVRVQALPGGSQALSVDHLFGPDHLAEKSGAQWLLHSITNYDNTDNWLYELDNKDLADPTHLWLRQGKTVVGPYFIQMLQVKFRDFLNKDERKNLLWADEPLTSRQGASERALGALDQACRNHQINLAIFFVPDSGELLNVSKVTGSDIETLCKKLNLPFFNLAQSLWADPKVDLNRIFRDDHIHLSAYGAEIAGQKLAKWFMEQHP